MRRVKEPLKLNVLVEMAVGDGEFRELLMRNPPAAIREYNRQMAEELNPLCNLPRFEVELLNHIAGKATDFRQFCRMVLEERERMEEQRQRNDTRTRAATTNTEERFEVLTLRSA